MSENKRIIIQQGYGGLGDHLQYSTLPEMYANQGYNVYISTENNYRNNDIFDLVWRHNPYIDGVSDLPPNAGNIKNEHIRWNLDSWTEEIEVAHGFTEKLNKYPKIYYKPNYISDLSDTVLYDTTAISQPHYFPDKIVVEHFSSAFKRYPGKEIKKIEYLSIGNRNIPGFEHKTYTIATIYDLCDAIYSCKAFICLFSGSSVLSAAIKQDRPTPDIISITPNPHKSNWKFENVEYNIFKND